MKYRIERHNGEPARYADSQQEALNIAESWMGQKLHQGAVDYVTDWTDANGERHYGYATDYWRDKENADREMGTTADIVIVKLS